MAKTSWGRGGQENWRRFPLFGTFFNSMAPLRYVPHSVLGVKGKGKALGDNIPLNERIEINQDLVALLLTLVIRLLGS